MPPYVDPNSAYAPNCSAYAPYAPYVVFGPHSQPQSYTTIVLNDWFRGVCILGSRGFCFLGSRGFCFYGLCWVPYNMLIILSCEKSGVGSIGSIGAAVWRIGSIWVNVGNVGSSWLLYMLLFFLRNYKKYYNL